MCLCYKIVEVFSLQDLTKYLHILFQSRGEDTFFFETKQKNIENFAHCK